MSRQCDICPDRAAGSYCGYRICKFCERSLKAMIKVSHPLTMPRLVRWAAKRAREAVLRIEAASMGPVDRAAYEDNP